jgi:hypothetical protein
MGAVLPDLTTEYVRVATVWVQEVESRRPDNVVTVAAASRESRVSDAGMPAPPMPTGQQNATEFMRQIVQDALGETVTHDVHGSVPDVPAPPDAALGTDPWQAVEALSDLLGVVSYFDRRDRLVTRPVPVLSTPVARLDPAHTVTGIWVVLERSKMANRVRLVFGSGSGEIVGDARDAVPGSPTEYGGPAGRILYTETRPGPVTQAQADAAAAAMLARLLPAFHRVGVDMVPDPRLEIGDTVSLLHPGGGPASYIVSGIELPIGPGDARLDMRAAPYGEASP